VKKGNSSPTLKQNIKVCVNTSYMVLPEAKFLDFNINLIETIFLLLLDKLK
jgi:hypothetical protein